tara:strand:+ start:93 stop:713 length:621 start_codon:yes stop_codon:yes gene_type:complete
MDRSRRTDDKKDTFFKEGVEHWIGKIVSVEAPSQRALLSGDSWGYRYRVRILIDYSNQDTVKDNDVFTAQSFVPLTAGTGAAERLETLKLAPGDMVFGLYLGEKRTAPFILHAFVRGENVVLDDNGKFTITSGFTDKVKPGLMAGQELSQTSCPNTPLLKKDANKGNGKGKGAPLSQLKNLAGGLGANVVGAFGKLSGNKRGSGVN